MEKPFYDDLIALLCEREAALSSSGERHDRELARLFRNAARIIEDVRSLAGQELRMPETVALLRDRFRSPIETEFRAAA